MKNLSRVGRKYNFRRENFRRLLACAAEEHQISWAKLPHIYSHKTLNFFSLKVPTVRYAKVVEFHRD